MDLQAILNASDDDGSSDDDDMQLPLRTSSLDNVDLEDILREEDDDDDDDPWLPSAHSWKPEAAVSSPRSTTTPTMATTSSSLQHQRPQLQTSHNAEDWAVLQQILNEEDDEDEDEEEDMWLQKYTSGSAPLPDRKYDVDSIVGTMSDDDDSDDVDLSTIVGSIGYSSVYSGARDASLVSAATPQSTQDVRTVVSHAEGAGEVTTKPPLPTSNGGTAATAELMFKKESQNHHNSRYRGNHSASASLQKSKEKYVDPSAQDEEIYRRSLAHAQSAERKLLKAGHREIVSPLMVKRRLRSKVELTARGDSKAPTSKNGQQQQQAKSAAGGPRFGGSGLVENKPMKQVSSSLKKHADLVAAKVFCGLPTCVAFNSKFIAVGTQKGIVLIFDLFEVLRQRLGAAEDIVRQSGAITSLDIAHNGEAVIAGYTTGALIMWDTIRGIVLRTITDSHTSPITCVRFLSDLKAVTVDASGLVNKLNFTKNMIWVNYSVDEECLLDGTAGQILAMNVLPPYHSIKPGSRPEAYEKGLQNLTLIALSPPRSSFVVAVDPKVNVLHRWARPPDESTVEILNNTEDDDYQEYLPCLAWGWALSSGGKNVVMPVLARSWGCCLQLLVASFPTIEDESGPPAGGGGEEQVVHWPAFGVQQEIDTEVPVISLEWLNDRSLVFLTATNEFTVVDTVMMTLIERLDFSGLKLVYAEFSLSRSAQKESENGTTGKVACKAFQNSSRYSDERLMVLCQDELRCVSAIGARRRISSLEGDGEWLEALAFALDHFENTVLSQEDRRRDPTGRRDLSRHPEFSTAKADDDEWIAKLLIRYLNLAVDNAPEASADSHSVYSQSELTGRIDLASSHFQMLAGVCVEFCVVTRRLDILFGPIFRRFQSSGYISVFLDVLEPYVLNDKLAYIAPEVMSFFVEHCKATTSVATVERCLLHMDCTIMDFDSILQLLRGNKMFSALFFVFNQGLDDYVTPLEIVLEKIFTEADNGGVAVVRRSDCSFQNDFERLGYKALLYLQSCFLGKTFPQEKPLEPEERAHSVKLELLRFLMQERFSPSPHTKNAVTLVPTVGQRSMRFPYIRVLLLVDPRGMLETLSYGLDSIPLLSHSTSESLEDWVHSSGQPAGTPDLQEIMIDIASILLPKSSKDQTLAESNIFKRRGAVNAFLDFAANFVINGTVRLEKAVAFMIIERVAKQYSSASEAESRQSFQRKAMDVLSALPRDSYDPDRVLDVFVKSSMHRASLLLHQQVASSWGDDELGLRTRHFLSAIDCYIDDEDPLFRMNVFKYVKKECSGVTERGTLRESLFDRLSALVHLDPLMTARLAAELFADELDRVIDGLQANDRGEGQFLFLNAIISGDLADADPAGGSVLSLTVEHHHKYLSLMARLHPELVYDYLATHDNYRTEECLKLCQEYDIADASAYLLERMGNVSAALQLILQTLETLMMNLKRTIRGLGVEKIRQQAPRRYGNRDCKLITLPRKQEAEVANVRRILVVALDVCERNSGNFASTVDGASKFSRGDLWFNVLDRLINAKGFLRLTKEQPEHANILSNVLSELLRLTMQRMVSSVPLSDLVRKVTSDHSGSRIGELREMVEGLLSSYNFELNVLKGASRVFNDDVRSMRDHQLQLRKEGSAVQTVMNTRLNGSRQEVNSLAQHPLFQTGFLEVGQQGGDARFVESDRLTSNHRIEQGLLNSMKRLRKRRAPKGSATAAQPTNMMTETEKLYQQDLLEPALFADRRSGSLGAAENRGRLVTF